jgi:hypothetical protein
MLQEGFREKYDKVCVGNMPGEPQDIYYEGMLLEPGLGMHSSSVSCALNEERPLVHTGCYRS